MARPNLRELQLSGGLSSRSEVLSSEEIAHLPEFDVARRLVEVWRTLPGAPIPAKSALKPENLPSALLPHLVILDVIDLDGSERDYRWRIFGSLHEAEFGANLTGVALSDLLGENPSAKDLKVVLDAAVARAGPLFFRLAYLSKGRLNRHASGVALPLADDDNRMQHLLIAVDWLHADS